MTEENHKVTVEIPEELPEWMVRDIIAIARGHCESSFRLLYEAQEAGLTDETNDYAHLMLESKRLTGGQTTLLRRVVEAHYSGGRYDPRWWVGEGGPWGDQVLAASGAAELWDRVDKSDPTVLDKFERLDDLVNVVLEFIQDEFEDDWWADLRSAQADWAWMQNRMMASDHVEWKADAHTAPRQPIRRGKGPRINI